MSIDTTKSTGAHKRSMQKYHYRERQPTRHHLQACFDLVRHIGDVDFEDAVVDEVSASANLWTNYGQ